MSRNDSDLGIRWKKENLRYHGRKHAEEYAESDQTLFYSLDHVTIRNWLSDYLKVENKKINKLLDLGCGTGRWFHVMENVDFVLGVDFSGEMLSKAKEKIYGEGYTNNINLARRDIFNLRGCPTITKQPTDNISCTDIKSSSSSQHPFTL